MASFLLPRDGSIVRFSLVIAFYLLPFCVALVAEGSFQLDIIEVDTPFRRSPDLGRTIFDRADSSSCPSDDYTQCGAAVPDNMCCEEDTSCMILASNTTLVCCPSGSSCELIKPITCEISQQDPLEHPGSAVQTVALDKSMKECGDGCCPFGYLCSDDNCKLDPNQDRYDYLLSDSTSTTTEPTSTATSISSSVSASVTTSASASGSMITSVLNIPTSATSATGTSTAAAETNSSGAKSTDDNKSSTGVIAACSIGGVCAAAAGVFILIRWFRKKHNAYQQQMTPDQVSEAFWDTPRSTRYLLARGPDDKYRMTPSTPGSMHSPPPPPPPAPAPVQSWRPRPRTRCHTFSPTSPIELPATPVSMSCWIEGAEVVEPKLAYVLPARKINKN